MCRIAEDARGSEYRQVLAEYESAKLEYDGFADLNKRGLQSEIVLAKARAALEQSKTRTEDARLALEKTSIVAPFNGVVTEQQVEVGDYLSPGAVCVSLMEVDPMLVAGQIAEKSIGLVNLESEVSIQLITGRKLCRFGELSWTRTRRKDADLSRRSDNREYKFTDPNWFNCANADPRRSRERAFDFTSKSGA